MANKDEDKKVELTSILDDILEDYTTEDVEKVDKEGTGSFEDLPDGYYLCSVDAAELGQSKTTEKLMASFKCTVVEDGVTLNDNDELVYVTNTKNRKIFKHYVLQNEDPKKQKDAIDRLVSDIKKFEGEPGVPLVQPLFDELKAGSIKMSEFIQSSLEFLTDMQIYIQVVRSEKNGQVRVWYRLISWERAAKLVLPGATEA